MLFTLYLFALIVDGTFVYVLLQNKISTDKSCVNTKLCNHFRKMLSVLQSVCIPFLKIGSVFTDCVFFFLTVNNNTLYLI